MDFEALHNLVDCELDKIATKKELSDTSLANLYKLVDVKKDLFEIEDMEMNNMNGGSYRSYPYRGDGYSRRNSRMMPHYGTHGYSMDNGEESSYSYLEEAMKHAASEQEREAIRKLMNQNYR